MLSDMRSRHVACCSWSLQAHNPAELAFMVEQCDLQSVQLELLPLANQSSWIDTSSILSDHGITVLSGMLAATGEDYTTLESIARTGGLRQDAMWSSTLENAISVADIAASMALPLVTFHAGFVPESDCQERTKMLGRLQTLAEEFGSRNILLGLETGQECAENVVSILEELNHPHLGVNYDPANMILYGKGNPIEAIKTLRPWVQQVHIKDAKETTKGGTWGTEVAVGQGDVPWEEFLQLVPDKIDLVIEREGGDARIEDIRQAKKLIEELGAC